MPIEKEIFKIVKKFFIKQEVSLMEDGVGDASVEQDVRAARNWKDLQKVYGKKYVLYVIKAALKEYGA